MCPTRCLVVVLCGLGACGLETAGLGTGGASGVGGSGGKVTGSGGEGTGGPGSGGTGGGSGGRPGGGMAGRGAAGTGGAGGSGGAGMTPPCPGGATYTYVLRSLASMGPVKLTGGGTTREIFGFDLDGRDSDGTRAEDCGVIDGSSSDGRRGIDNTIAGLWAEDLSPAFEPGRMAGAVTTIRLDGVDSFDDDDCVDIAWSASTPQFQRARIEAGLLIAEGSDILPLLGKATPLNASSPLTVALPLSSPHIAFRASPQALDEGVIGGSVTTDQLISLYRTLFGSLVDGLSVGFLHPDLPDLPAGGQPCTLLSAGFAFDARVSPGPAN